MNDVPAIRVEHLTVAGAAGKDSTLLKDIDFSVPQGSIAALLGGTESLEALMQCLTGARRTESGRVSILGLSASSRWRLRSRRRFVPAGRDPAPALGNRRPPGLLLLETPERAAASGLASTLRSLASRGTAILFTTSDAALAEAAADRIGILARGRLIAYAPGPELHSRFRRIHYVNQATETRAQFGNELDAFDALRVRVRGWGIEAIVSNFEDSVFERFRRMDGVADAVAESVTLGEIVAAATGREGGAR